MAHVALIRIGAPLMVGAAVAITWAGRAGGEASTAPHTARAREAHSQAVDPAEPRQAAARKAKVDQAATAALAAILRPEDSERARAVAALRELGPDALVTLREFLERGVDDPMGSAAAYALAAVGDDVDHGEIASQFLARQVDPPPLLALAAAELKDPQLVDVFASLRESPDADIRLAVTRGLRGANDAPIRDLLPLLADPEPRVRASAERTLIELVPKANATAARRETETALSSADPSIRVAALRLAVAFNAPWVDGLAAQAARDKDRDVRREAVDVLGRRGQASSAAALVELVNKGADRYERVHAATALGTVAAPAEALDALAKVASGSDPIVALAAARTLAERRDPRAIPSLVRLGSVEESARLRVDSEDVELLRDMSSEILDSASRERPRRSGETWEAWWARVGPGYRMPVDTSVPAFPANH